MSLISMADNYVVTCTSINFTKAKIYIIRSHIAYHPIAYGYILLTKLDQSIKQPNNLERSLISQGILTPAEALIRKLKQV